jgi:hypothetical protein
VGDLRDHVELLGLSGTDGTDGTEEKDLLGGEKT